MMAVAALLATFTSVNANVYGVVGLTSALARSGQFPPKFAHPGRFGSTMGMGVSSLLVLLLALLVDLTAIASLGSVVALVIFLMVALAGMRLRAETGSNIVIIGLGIVSTAVVLLVFGIQTWQDTPETFVAMIVVLGLAVVLELVWSAVLRRRQGTPPADIQ